MGRTERAGRDDAVIVAIGDVHGRADLCEAVVGKVERAYQDRPLRFVFLGDYVDRGPDSRGVLDALLALREARPDTVLLKGNHEQALLDWLADPVEGEAWLDWGGEATLQSYGVRREPDRALESLRDEFAEALPDRHFALLMDMPLTHREADYLFVHAGLHPDRTLEEQTERDLLWVREPWHVGGKGRFPGLTVVHGHTPVDKPENKSWRINVDTGAVWTSRLTAVCLDGQKRRFLST